MVITIIQFLNVGSGDIPCCKIRSKGGTRVAIKSWQNSREGLYTVAQTATGSALAVTPQGFVNIYSF